jgi:hypothetical protein
MTIHEDNLALAHRYAAAGMPVFPVNEKKKPMVEHWKEDATTDPEKIDEFWRSRLNAGVALHLEPCRLIVIDADRRDSLDGVSELEKLIQKHGQLPPHPVVDTPGGGEHHIFSNPGGLGNSAGGFRGLGIDIRGRGGYVVASGTVNQRGLGLLVRKLQISFRRFKTAHCRTCLIGSSI